MKHPRRKSLEKKLAAAISVVNLLNAGAPIALPYVNLTKRADGALPGALVHVAEANEYYYDYVNYVLDVNYGDTTTIGELADAWVNVGGTNIVKKVTGGMQLIGGNAVGQIDLNLAGGQVLSYGNSHGNITVLSGGYQAIEHNASGTIETMYGGKQSISGGYAANGQDRDSKGIGSVGTLNGGIQSVGYDGGTAIARVMNGGTQVAGGYHPDLASVGTMNGGTQFNWGDTTVIDVMNGGTQIVGQMDTTKWHKGKIGTMKGGMQSVGWGDGSIDVLSGGTQFLESLPFQATVSVGTMYGGTQVITNYQDRDPRSGGGIISTIIGGVQDLSSSTWGTISSMSGGTQIVSLDATGTISSMSGGTQIVSSGGTGTISSFLGGTQIVSSGGSAQNEKVSSGAVLEEHSGAKFTNVTYAGGTHRIVDLEKNGYAADNRTLEVGSGAKTSGTQVKAGSMEVVLKGGSSTDAVIESGGSQIVSGGTASLTDLSSGATQTVYGGSAAVTNIKSGAAQIVSGGSVSAETLEYGGEQDVYGGEVTLSNMKVGGTQYVFGGIGSVSTVSGGTQVAKDDWKDSTQVVSGGTGKIGTLVSNGNQMVAGGTGMVSNIERDGLQYIVAGAGVAETVSNHGQQHVYGGSGTIKTMNGGLQVISVAHVSVTVNPGGKGTIEVFNGGTQQIFSGGTGSVGTLAGGRIEMFEGGVFKGNITGRGTLWNVSMGGTVTASDGGITAYNLSVGTLAVEQDGSVYVYTDGNNPRVVGDLKANTIAISSAPTNGLIPVSATNNITVGTVDFTGLKAEKAPEEYTFVSAGGTLSDLTVKRNDFTATLTSGGRIEGKKSRETTTPTEVLTLGYEVAHTLSHTGKALTYKFENTGYTDAAFDGTVPWTSGGTYFDAKDYAFVSNPTVDLAKLGFSFTVDETAAASLKKGQSMTLLADVSGATIGAPAPASFALSRTGNNTALSGTANGKATVDGSAVKYTLDSVTLDNVTVTGVDGAADSVPEGWTSNTAGVAVDAGSFTTPLSAVSEKKILLTAQTAMFSDGNITGDNKYATGKTFSDADAGVTISGTWSHGIYASSDGKSLVFDAGDVKANGVALGAMTWGTPRVLTGEYGCDFSGVTTVDASGLSFTGLDASVTAGTHDLLTGANNLAKATVTGVDHTQTFTAGTANGANLSATLSGSVSTAADKVRYEAKVTLDGADLSGWNGTASSEVPASWTANTDGIAVTGSFKEPANVIPGTSREILTTETKNFFSSAQIDEAMAFKAYDFNDEDAGVAFAGTQSKGVAVGGDKLNNLVYTTTEKNVADIILGSMTWDNGRTVALADGYAFMNAKADASNLSFTFTDDQKAALSKGSKMTLLDGATSLSADTTTVTGADRTQIISLEAANGTVLDGTLTGAVSAADRQLVYQAESMTLDNVELSGRNSMSTSAAVPDGWTKGKSPVSVVADGPAPHPEDLPQGETTILTSTNGVFADAKITGVNAYGVSKEFADMKNGVTLSGTWARGVRTADSNALVFVNGDLEATGVALGETDRAFPRELDGAMNCSFSGVEQIDATNLVFRNPESIPVGSVSPLLTGANDLKAGLPVTYANGAAAHTQNIEGYDPGNGATLDATLKGTVSTTAGTVNYTADSTRLTGVSLAGWNGLSSAAVPDDWTAADVPVETGSFEVSDDLLAGVSQDILTTNHKDAFGTVSGDNVYKTVTGENEKNGVTLTGSVDRGVKAGDDKSVLRYVAGNYAVSGIAVGETTFVENGVLRTVSNEACDYSAVGAVDASAFSLTNPTEVAPGRSMTLLAANDTLRDLAAQTKEQTYSLNPAEGVTLAGRLTGNILANGGSVKYAAAENRAESLTFGAVEWKDSGALMARPEAISFDGAAVDTSQIAFTGVDTLADQSTMTLVSNFDGAPGSITGDTYRIGLAFEGKGSASMNGSDLIFRTESAPAPGRAAHRTLMAGLVGMATLSAGNEFIGAAAEGLSLDSNVGSDGVSTFAKLGGGNIRQETGSHIDVRTWNAILALGQANKKERGTFRYGAFFEYGTGNYTTHEDGFRGDGSARYTGGGLLAKWTANHGFYVEGSLRAGSIHNDARNVLREADGTPHSFETNTPYFGAHIGVGKEIELKGGNSLDIYGKYFYNRRNSTSFDAGGHFDLDAVTSGVLSVGARYLMKREKWNFYGGLAYQHEFDGTAAGRVNGLAIRSADIGGGSVKLELGATVKPDEKSPWSLDLSLTGFAGKKRGMMGGVSVAWMF